MIAPGCASTAVYPAQRVLDKFSSFVLKFCFGPLPDPFGSFGTKKSAIDAENAKESENRAKTPNKSQKKTPFGIDLLDRAKTK